MKLSNCDYNLFVCNSSCCWEESDRKIAAEICDHYLDVTIDCYLRIDSDGRVDLIRTGGYALESLRVGCAFWSTSLTFAIDRLNFVYGVCVVYVLSGRHNASICSNHSWRNIFSVRCVVIIKVCSRRFATNFASLNLIWIDWHAGYLGLRSALLHVAVRLSSVRLYGRGIESARCLHGRHEIEAIVLTFAFSQ